MRSDYPDIVKGVANDSGPSVTSFTIASDVTGFESWDDVPAQEVQFYARTASEHITGVGDYDGIDEITNITVLKGSAGAGTMPNWTAGGITISYAVLGIGYSRFLDILGDKPLTEPVFAVGFGQSKWVPYPALNTSALPDNPNVFDLNNGGSGSTFSFTQLDPNATIHGDAPSISTPALYTGHPRGGRGGTFLGWADFIQRFRGGNVFIVWTHWGAASFGLSFYPYAGSPFGTGWEEFYQRVEDAKSAESSLPSHPDFYFQRAGWSDAAILNTSESTFVESHFRMQRFLEDIGFLSPDTVRVYFENEDEVLRTSSTGGELRNRSYYKTIASLSDNAILVPMQQSDTPDQLHKDGNAQVADGARSALACLYNLNQARQATPGHNYIRPLKNLQFWADYIAVSASQPTTLDNEFNTDSGETVLRVPWSARDAAAGADDSYTYTHVDQIFAEEFWDGTQYCYRLHVEEVGDDTVYCNYEITGVNDYSDGLPATAGSANNKEFEIDATDQSVSWPPSAGTECEITLQRWDGDSWETAEIYADDGSAEGYHNLTTDVRFATQDKEAGNQPFFYGTRFGAGVPPLVRIPALVRDSGLVDSLGTTKYILEGRSTITTPPSAYAVGLSVGPGRTFGAGSDGNILGVMDGVLSVVGRRTDGAPTDDEIYSAKFPFISNYHSTGGTDATAVHNEEGSLFAVVNPTAITWDTDLGPVNNSSGGFGSVDWPDSGGVLQRCTAFYLPAKTSQTWVWDWVLEFTFREN